MYKFLMQHVRFHILIILLLVFAGRGASAQITMGHWRTHLPYQYATLAEATKDRVYCSTTGGLFYYHLEDHSLAKLSKVDGLSDVGVSEMRWSDQLETLILAYENSNIDIVTEGEIVNIPDIMKKQITGDKSINDIFFLDSIAFLSMGFGIVELNLEKEEVSETYYIGDLGEALCVNQVTSDGVYLYAATDMGIRRGLLSDPFLVDYNNWETISDIPHALETFSAIAWRDGTFFAAYSDPAGLQDLVYYNNGSSWLPYSYFTGSICYEILNQGEYISIVSDSTASLVAGNMLVIEELISPSPRSASRDNNEVLWVADYGNGLVSMKEGNLWSIKPNGPTTTSTFGMASSEGVLHMVPGAVNTSWQNLWQTATLQSFSGNEWSYRGSWDERDLITLAIDPGDPNHVYAGSWGYGLIEFSSEGVTRYTEENSSLQTFRPGDFIRIGGVTYDQEGNLWMTNTNVQNPISVLKKDGSWKSFRLDNLLTEYNALGDILVTQSGHKWVIVPRGYGLFAMDDNFTIDDETDDEYKKVSVVDRFGKVITNDVYSFAEDHNGNIWLGTNQGVLVFYSPYRLFQDGSIYAQEILIPRNDGSGLADALLGTQVVTSIEVDGANRKWLGTAGGGAYLVSDDGLEEIYHFNSTNSPLLADYITDICVDGVSGEVYFGTEKGLISYMGDALTGSEVYDQVKVYPNPVRENYEGPVAIKGLLENTNVKITDIGGNLVFETTSLGGQAVWDGKNFRGDRVATGVYLVYLASEDGSFSHVTKLLFIH